MTENKYNWVYILKCGDGSLYAGMTGYIAKRYAEHITKTGKCKYTRRRDKHPLKLVSCWKVFGTRGDAMKVEIFIKKCNRNLKEEFIKAPDILENKFENHREYKLRILPFNDIDQIERDTKELVNKIYNKI